MTTSTTSSPSAAVQRAKHLWTVTGLGLLLYIVFHVLSMLLKGVPAGFAGGQDAAMWTWTLLLGIAFLPTLLSALGESRVVAWIVFALGLLTLLLALLIAYQYGIAAGAGYIALILILIVFAVVPGLFALATTLRWARGR